MKKKIFIKNKQRHTTIILKNNFIEKYIKDLLKKNKKIFCIIDAKLFDIFKALQKNKNIKFIKIKCGEGIKNIKIYNYICENLLKNQIDRESQLIVIGGGTLGDLCGFVASTLLRGVKFTLIPTTLLSQVDSSIGGKNGINSKYGKNLIGTFYHPDEVIIDTTILKSLPKREMKSGYSEILKHALINDYNFFKWLDKNQKKLFNLQYKIIEKAILKSLMIKLWYVKKDPEEKLINNNSRAMLNFGHTFGHSLEAFYKFNKKINHGEAVSLGMVIESKISNKLGYLSDRQLNIILKHFYETNLKTFDGNIKNEKIFKFILKDKKNIDNKINIVLLKNIGNSFFARNIPIMKIKETINSL